MNIAEAGGRGRRLKDIGLPQTAEPDWAIEEEVARYLGFQNSRYLRQTLFDCLNGNNLLAEAGTMPPLAFPPKHHDGSDARYLADYLLGIEEQENGSRILISVLPNGAETSKHAHPFAEEYWILAGQSISIERISVFEPHYQVLPYQPHQLKTVQQPALLVIKMHVGTTSPENWYIGRVSANGTRTY